jgi:hypothetical protein
MAPASIGAALGNSILRHADGMRKLAESIHTHEYVLSKANCQYASVRRKYLIQEDETAPCGLKSIAKPGAVATMCA